MSQQYDDEFFEEGFDEAREIIEEQEEIIEDQEEFMEDQEEVMEEQEEIIEEQASELQNDDAQVAALKAALARNQADFENFKKRTERDKADMVFFIKNDIFKKILPRVDDLSRIIENTPEDMRQGALYEGVIALQKSLLKDLKSLGVEPFDSLGMPVNPDMHEVMTQVPGEEGIIVDEFETGYMLGDRVLRVAKVVVGNG